MVDEKENAVADLQQKKVEINSSQIADYLFRSAHEFIRGSMEQKADKKEEASIIMMVAAGAMLQPMRDFLTKFPSDDEKEQATITAAFEYLDRATAHLSANLIKAQEQAAVQKEEKK